MKGKKDGVGVLDDCLVAGRETFSVARINVLDRLFYFWDERAFEQRSTVMEDIPFHLFGPKKV